MPYIVATERLSKRYGTHAVVDNLNLRVPQGCVYGFLGPNGSGKSTTMKMLLSLVRPTDGEVEVMGSPMNRATRRELLGNIGSLIESPPGYGHLTGRENMRLVQRLLGLENRQVDRAVHTVRLQEHLDKKVGNYSLGMKQRLGIAMALAREPRLLILDEPTNGLDPAGIEEIRDLLRRLTEQGVTVMVSSHLLGEIDKTATVLGIVSNGRMLFQGTRAELFAVSTPDVLIDSSDPLRAASLLADEYKNDLDEHSVRLPGLDDRATERVVAHPVGAGIGGLGSIVAVFASDFPAWLAHATPWGYYALVAAADYRGGELVALTPSYPSMTALGVVGGALFLLVTGLFDRQED